MAEQLVRVTRVRVGVWDAAAPVSRRGSIAPKRGGVHVGRSPNSLGQPLDSSGLMNPYPSEGQLWAHFEIRSEIARGNMGVVYRAFDTRTRQEVALKILVGGHDNPDSVERFKREAKSLARLSHPNIVCVHSYGVQLELPFLTMDYVPGTTLQELLNRGALPLARAVDLLARMARGLDHVHSRGVLHRDVKPANVLIGSDGQPRITDFGLAKLSDASLSLTQDGDIIGTPVFMSPEQIQGQQKLVGPSTDVWALGVILYVMLTNELPFRGRTVDTVSQAVVQMEPTLPRELSPGVPEDLERICLATLKKDARERYRSAGELARDLEAYLRGGQVLAGIVTPAVRLRRAARFVQLHAVAVSSAFAVLVILSTTLGLHFYMEAGSRDSARAERQALIDGLVETVDTAISAASQALATLDPKQAFGHAEQALAEVERAGEEAAQAVAAKREVLERLRDRARIQEGQKPMSTMVAQRLAEAFLEHGRLEDAEDWLEYAWRDENPSPEVLRAGLERLPALEEPYLLRKFRVVMRWRTLAGVQRPWEALLKEQRSPLREAANALEAAWLLDCSRLGEARAILSNAPSGSVPLLQARYVRGTRRYDVEVRSVIVEGAGDWETVHAHLVAKARSRSPRQEVESAVAEAEAALLSGEPRRAARIARAMREGHKLPMALATQLLAVEFLALHLREGKASRELEWLVGKRLAPRARLHLARIKTVLKLGRKLPYPPLARSKFIALADAASNEVMEAVGVLALRALGHKVPEAAKRSLGVAAREVDRDRLKEQAKRYVDPSVTSSWVIHQLQIDHGAKLEEVREEWFSEENDKPAWLTHPLFSLARRLTNERPFERLLPTFAPAPPGLAEGRAWAVRFAQASPNAAAADQARQRANTALAFGARISPAHAEVRLARSRLFLQRAAREGGRTQRKFREKALQEAAAALVCAPELPAARSLYLQVAWLSSPEDFAQVMADERVVGWLEPGEDAIEGADRLLIVALLKDRSALDGRQLSARLVAGRRYDLLQRARSSDPGLVSTPYADQLRGRMAIKTAYDEDLLWEEGELLLVDPGWLEKHLLGERPPLDATMLGLLRKEAGLPPAPGESPSPSGPFASAARALLLAHHLRHASRGASDRREGQALLDALWRDRPGPACFAFQAGLALLTRAPDPLLIGDLLGEPDDWRGGLVGVLEALKRGTPPPAPSETVTRLLKHKGIAPWTKACWKEE
jgi:tetratricopeptide (TPR) repeat protein